MQICTNSSLGGKPVTRPPVPMNCVLVWRLQVFIVVNGGCGHINHILNGQDLSPQTSVFVISRHGCKCKGNKNSPQFQAYYSITTGMISYMLNAKKDCVVGSYQAYTASPVHLSPEVGPRSGDTFSNLRSAQLCMWDRADKLHKQWGSLNT